MFHLTLIAAIVLLAIGFIAALVHYPLDSFAGENAKATRWAKAVRTFCANVGLWFGGFVAILLALVWLNNQNIWLYATASIVVGISVMAHFGTLAIGGISCPLFWRDMPTYRTKAILVATALVLLLCGVSGIYQGFNLFLAPVYSAIA